MQLDYSVKTRPRPSWPVDHGARRRIRIEGQQDDTKQNANSRAHFISRFQSSQQESTPTSISDTRPKQTSDHLLVSKEVRQATDSSQNQAALADDSPIRCGSPAQQAILNRHNRFSSQGQTTILPICCSLLILVALICTTSCVVVYQTSFVSLTSGRQDYAVVGESIQLLCKHTMKDEAEDIKQVTWSKDGKNFLRWRKNKPGLEVLSYTYKGHIDQKSTFSRLMIHNVTVAMHGKYVCSIKTDLGSHSGEHDLVVISTQPCKLNDWRIHSEQTKCRETLRFDCRNMFPKPVPSCGLWNSRSNKFIRSVSIDIAEENATPRSVADQLSSNKSSEVLPVAAAHARDSYRIRYSDKFLLKFPNGSSNPQQEELLQYAGNLIFKCDILVPETSWNISLRYKMFDFQDGCNQDPLETIERMRLNFSHYAAQRMQQAGYLSSRQLQHEDIEMLTSSLKYEIVPPSHFISDDKNSLVDKPMVTVTSHHAHNNNSKLTKNDNDQPKIDKILDLNCWQKPRVGSFARLTCANQHKNQVKLIGASLLECRPNGWWPVKSSVNNIGEPSVVRRQQIAEKLSALLTAEGRRSTRAERPDGQNLVPLDSDPNRLEGKPDIDDDDSNIESDGSTKVVQANNLLDDRFRLENEIRNIASEYEQLTPTELAALLPACVSIAPTKPRKQQNRLPMIEASSVNNQKGKLSSKNGRNSNDDPNWNWYIFSSSAPPSSRKPDLHQQALILVLIICASLLYIMTLSSSNRVYVATN